MNGKIDIERLSAYLDGELGADAAQDVETLAATDPAVAAALKAMQHANGEARRFLRQALPEAPDRLRATIEHGFAARGNGHRGSAPVSRWALPLAASILIAISGLVGGFLLSDMRLASHLAELEARQAADRQSFAAALQQVLETANSDRSVTWQGAATGAQATITPTRTYRSVSNHWCREFDERIVRDGITQDRTGLACRESPTAWRRVRTTIRNPDNTF